MSSYIYTLSSPPPSLNNIFYNLPTGGRAKTGEYKAWRRAAAWELAAQRQALGVKGPIAVPVAVEVLLPQAVRGDVDNRAKGALDALQAAGIILNDSLCDPVTIRRADVRQTTIHITMRGAS